MCLLTVLFVPRLQCLYLASVRDLAAFITIHAYLNNIIHLFADEILNQSPTDLHAHFAKIDIGICSVDKSSQTAQAKPVLNTFGILHERSYYDIQTVEANF